MVKHLLIKRERGASMTPIDSLQVCNGSVVGNVRCTPLRQVLILPEVILEEFNLQPGDLRENIIITEPGIHELPSGSVIDIGGVKIRLTFHCEPCKVIGKKVSIRKIMHHRGYLGSFLSDGCISIGDTVTFYGKEYEEIPYDVKDRIRWYLSGQEKPVFVATLVWDIGLPKSYCRVIPRLLKNMPDIDPDKVLYAKNKSVQIPSIKDAVW
jgi:hypothetical protein